MSDVTHLSQAAPSYAWVTNTAAPYRRPVWESIRRRASLTVYLLEGAERLRRVDGNRGQEWSDYRGSSYEVVEVPTARIARGEAVLYTATGRIFARGERPTAVVLGGWESPAYWQALAWCKSHRVPAVGFYESTLHTNRFTTGPIALARRKFVTSLQAVVVPGPAARDAVLHMGVPPDAVFMGFNAVDVAGIHEATSALRTPRADGTHSRSHRFLYVGRLIELKNVESLLEAFAMVSGPHDTLTIVGKGPNESRLRATAARLGLTDRVRFGGLVPYGELPSIFAAHDTLVLPSKNEVWGLVVNEALAAGLHVVVSDACGVASSVSGMEGVFVSRTDPASLAERMAKSRIQWSGPIGSPVILRETPERFADVFLAALAH
jgi:glycosyltransferase involved in cell wall biosynthesis